MMKKINKHRLAATLFLLFLTLTSANRIGEVVEKVHVKKTEIKAKSPTPKKYFIIPVKENNKFSKEIGKQAKYSISIDSIIDNLPQQLQPKQ